MKFRHPRAGGDPVDLRIAIRRFTARRSSSFISSHRATSSKVRKQLRQTSSPSTVVQWPMQGESEVISTGGSVVCMGRDYTG